MNRIVAASGTFNAFGSISCMLIVKRIWTCHMEFALYKFIIIIISNPAQFQHITLYILEWEHFQITNFNRAGGQGLPSSNFCHTNPLQNICEYLNCCQILYSNATDLKLGSSTYFFLLFPFLVFVKSQVLNLRVGRSHDPLMIVAKGLS